jgi:hypothetical protein
VVAISCCLCSHTVHALLRQGEGQEGRKRLGQQPSHVTSGSARYNLSQNYVPYLVHTNPNIRNLLSGMICPSSICRYQLIKRLGWGITGTYVWVVATALAPLDDYFLEMPVEKGITATAGPITIGNTGIKPGPQPSTSTMQFVVRA